MKKILTLALLVLAMVFVLASCDIPFLSEKETTATTSKETTPGGTTPEGTEPEGTTPEGTEPEGTTPEGTEPEGTTPEGTEPEETTPEETTPEETTPEETPPEETTPEEPEEPFVPSEGLAYTVNDDGKTCTVTGIGSCTDTVIYVGGSIDGYKITAINKKAFFNCTTLKSVTIGDSVKSIGEQAFQYCTALKSFVIGDGITNVDSYAFAYCDALTGVYVTDLSAWCNINFGNSFSNPLYYANNLYFNGSLVTDLVIPDGVTRISARAFYWCNSLTSVTIPDSVTSIGEYAFHTCTCLTSVTISDSVTSIDYSAFQKCNSALYTEYQYGKYIGNETNPYAILIDTTNQTKLTYQIHPNTQIIANSVFQGLYRLVSITIPDSVTSICDNAFNACTSLTSVYVTDLTSWCNINFGNFASNPLYYAKNLYLNGNLITELVIPDSVTSIGGYAFSNCTSLTSVTIGNSVTTIGLGTFQGCTSLTSVTFANPNGWWYANSADATSGTAISAESLADPATAAKHLKSTYYNYYWFRTE